MYQDIVTVTHTKDLTKIKSSESSISSWISTAKIINKKVKRLHVVNWSLQFTVLF